MQHVCQRCGNPFESPHKKAKFCSADCSHKAQGASKKIDRVCRLCGEKLVTPGQRKLCYCSTECRDSDPSRIVIDGVVHATCRKCGQGFTHPVWRTNDYCSQECGNAARRTISEVEKNCQHCGEVFISRDCANRQFCSQKCWHDHAVGENSPSWDSIDTECAQCGKHLKRQRYRIDGSERHFCNSRCRGDWHSEHLTGENNPLWKGGREHERGKNWLAQRKKALARDNYTCQHCGATKKQIGRTPAVHHIIPFREFGVERYKEANDLTNLITLCPACHMRAEHNLIPIQPYLLSVP